MWNSNLLSFYSCTSYQLHHPPLILCTWWRQSSVLNNPSSLPAPLLPASPPPLQLKARDLTFVWTMPALWSLKCSRVAAISISLAPATDRKLDWVQSGVIQLTSVNLSLYRAPFGTAERLKIITFIPGKTWTRATNCFSIKYARGYFFGGGFGKRAIKRRKTPSAGFPVRVVFRDGFRLCPPLKSAQSFSIRQYLTVRGRTCARVRARAEEPANPN